MRNIKWFKVNPRLISIHVPKTAGTSFYKSLKESYGVRAKRIQWPEDVAKWNRGELYKANKPFIEAVYGHIQAHPNWLSQYPNAKLITWLRDPTERVISHYYHWVYLGGSGAGGNVHFQNFKADTPGLLHFVSSKKYQSTVKAYEAHLGKVPPARFDFVGRTEHFEKDLVKLESLIGKKLARVEDKRNANLKKPQVSVEERQQITELLKSEYDLYHELLKAGGHQKPNS